MSAAVVIIALKPQGRNCNLTTRRPEAQWESQELDREGCQGPRQDLDIAAEWIWQLEPEGSGHLDSSGTSTRPDLFWVRLLLSTALEWDSGPVCCSLGFTTQQPHYCVLQGWKFYSATSLASRFPPQAPPLLQCGLVLPSVSQVSFSRQDWCLLSGTPWLDCMARWYELLLNTREELLGLDRAKLRCQPGRRELMPRARAGLATAPCALYSHSASQSLIPIL